MDYKNLIDHKNLKSDNFSTFLDIQILEIKKGYAKGRLPISDFHLNPIGSVHGGCIFTLADVVGGTAAMTHSTHVATISGNMNYLTTGINTKEIIAIATEKKAGKHIMTYALDIYNDKEQLLSSGTFSYYSLDEQVEM